MNEKLKVDDYGDMVAKIKGKKLLYYHCFGTYEGEWLAILDNLESVEIWSSFYGSCGVCDFLEGQGYEVSIREALEYLPTEPFLIIPKRDVKNMALKDLESLLPRNRKEYGYSFDLEDVLKCLQEIK